MIRKKRLTAFALACMMGIMTLAPAGEAFADEVWSKVDGAYKMIDGSEIDGVYARGIDTSHWQGQIDWATVAANDVEFVMLGTRYKGTVDPKFHYNATEANKHGIKIGAYIYSYALTPEMALAEADYILDLIKDYPISYPVAFDLEDSSQNSLSKAQINELIDTFCGRIADAGYYPMIYANEYWLNNKIDTSKLKYDVWVARYQVKHTFSNPAMWQATNTGRIGGISGNVDINFQYKDFSGLIPSNTWRTIGTSTYYYQDFQMQKSSWINDGKGWFYMNETGNPSKGWLNQSDTYYYLDETSGKMNTGWKSLDNNWYYFADSGKMTTGWTQVGDSRYYMDQYGVMQTGWFDQNNHKYYLQGSGAAATGWLQMDNAWYYFNGDGTMGSGWVNPDGNWYLINNDGKMAAGWYNDQTGSYYLSTSSGKMTTGWRQIDNSWYYFNGSGMMSRGWTNVNNEYYYLGTDGKMVTGWCQVDNSWYYLNESGQRQIGKTTINGVDYYLNPEDGRMAANTTVTFDGVEYQIDGSGAMSKVTPPAESETAPAANGTGNTETETSAAAPDGGNSTSDAVVKGPGM